MKIIAVSTRYATMKHGDQKAMLKIVNDTLSAGRTINSASGSTAALAINWCEARGIPWRCTAGGLELMYYFEMSPDCPAASKGEVK